MNAIVLGAGLGTRLGSMGRRVPKVLIDVAGRPLLHDHLDFLRQQGIRRVVVNTHHLAELVEAFVDAYAGPLEVVCLREERLLGTAGAVRNALRDLEPGPFAVLYGDVVITVPLAPMLELHRQTGALATLAVHEAHDPVGKGVVGVDERGRVTGFAEKHAAARAPALVNSGLYVVESELIAMVPPGGFSDFGRDLFPDALARGSTLSTYRLSTPAIDIGTPQGLSLARSSARELRAVRDGSPG